MDLFDNHVIRLMIFLVLQAVPFVFVAFFILNVRGRTRFAKGILAPWALANGYQFVSLKKKWFLLGPFRWHTGNAVVFQGVVLTPDGEQRSGYIRVGTFFLGLWIDQVTVKWEE
jgi:hypothetical protein